MIRGRTKSISSPPIGNREIALGYASHVARQVTRPEWPDLRHCPFTDAAEAREIHFRAAEERRISLILPERCRSAPCLSVSGLACSPLGRSPVPSLRRDLRSRDRT